MSVKIAILGILLLTAVGCSSWFWVDPHDSAAVQEKVEIERDTFKNIVYYRGPEVSNTSGEDSDAPEVEGLQLHARTEGDRTTRYFLSVTDYYEGDWRGFDQAYDSTGGKFHALAVKHKVNCHLFCGYAEMLDIELTRQYLEAHANTGITLRLYGPSGAASAPFTLPAGYLQGFLKGLKGSFGN